MELTKYQSSYFTAKILEFYSSNTLAKPWQLDRNPYKIWLLEVLSQQTRMGQAIPYYERIIARFPTLQDLAKASEDELFSLWKGLGYYSRARNLHFTSKYIVNELENHFPNNYQDLLKLKGVGEYTAAAIASFAYREHVAVLDGNVHRVLSRIFGIYKTLQSSQDKQYFQSIANKLLPKGKSDIFNQSMMNLGSQVCTPQNPRCEECLMSTICYAFKEDKIADLPPKKTRITLKERYLYCLFVEYQGKIYVQKRIQNDIWKGLYQGILQEGEELDTTFWKETIGDYKRIKWSDWQKQILSHQRIFMKIGYFKAKSNYPVLREMQGLNSIENTPFPRVISRWWENSENILL